MLSTTMIGKKYNLTAKPHFFNFLINHGYIEKDYKYYKLTSKGFSVGGEYKCNEKGEKWIVWNEKQFYQVIKDFKLSVLKKNRVFLIYHMTHIRHLDTILKYGLFSHNNPYKKVDISNQEVNNRRDKIEPIYNESIHNYVPFYFNPRNAMLYRNKVQFGDNIIILGFSNKIICKNNVVFTNANAAADNTLFTNDITQLLNNEFIDFSKVFSNSWNNYGEPDYHLKQIMMSEVLIKKHVESQYIQVIFCQNESVKSYIRNTFNIKNIQLKVNNEIFF